MAAGHGMDFEKWRSSHCLSLPGAARFHLVSRTFAKRCRLVVVGTFILLVAFLVQFGPHSGGLSTYFAWVFGATPSYIPEEMLHENVEIEELWSSLASNSCFERLSDWSWRQLPLRDGGGEGGEDNGTSIHGGLAGGHVGSAGGARVGRNGTSGHGESELSEGLVWTWDDGVECGLHRRGRSDMLDLLKGSWLVVIGDSQARFILVAFLRLLLPDFENVRQGLFKRHSNYELTIPEANIRFLFVWAPYEQDITATLQGFASNGTCPDVVIMGAGLWHMLHVADTADFRRRMGDLEKTAFTFFASPVCKAGRGTLSQSEDDGEDYEEEQEDSEADEKFKRLVNKAGLGQGLTTTANPLLADAEVANSQTNDARVEMHFNNKVEEDSEGFHEDAGVRNRSTLEGVSSGKRGRGLLFYMNLPQLIHWKLNTEEKKKVMSPERLAAYDLEIRRRAMWFPSGPGFLLDLLRVSRECGHECSEDGMHYDVDVYEGLVQIVGGVLSLLDNLTQS